MLTGSGRVICNFTLLGLRGWRAWHWLGLRAGGGPVAGLLCRVAAPAPRPVRQWHPYTPVAAPEPRPGALALGAVSVSL